MPDTAPVIFCTDGIYPHAVGGMQRHSRLLIEELLNQGVKLVVIHPHPEPVFAKHHLLTEIAVEGINPGANYLLECLRYSKRLHEIILRYPDSVVYAQGLSVWYRAKDFSKRLIVNPHGLEPFQAIGLKNKIAGFVFQAVFRHIFRKALKVVSLGGRLTGILARILPAEKIVVLPNAVIPLQPKDKTFPDSNQPVKLFFIARFAHNKGIKVLLQAISELNKEGFADSISYTLAGKGPLYDLVISEYKMPNVKYPGFVTDDELADHYAESDLFVFPTLFEGMPTVVLEAMSHGLPVIVSDTGATAELVDETNGFLIAKNNVEELKKSIIAFYRMSAESKKECSEKSLEKINKRFTWEKTARTHIQLFNEISSSLTNQK